MNAVAQKPLKIRAIRQEKHFTISVGNQNLAIATHLRNQLLRAASLYFSEAEQLREGELPGDAAKRVLDEVENRPNLMRFLSQAVTQVPLDTDMDNDIKPDGMDDQKIAMALATYLHRKNRDSAVEEAVVVDG